MTGNLCSAATRAREGARQTNGRFGEQGRTDPGQLGLDGDTESKLAATRPDDVCVSEVADPVLDAASADAVLAGRHDEAQMWLSELHADELDENLDGAVADWCADAGVDMFRLDESGRATAVEWLGEQDQGDIVGQAVEADPPRILHAPLASGTALDPDGVCGDPRSLHAREEAIARALAGRGISPLDPRSLRELANGGPDRWGPDTTLDVVWHGRVADVAPERGPGTSTDVTLSGTRLLLADSRTGIGHDVPLESDVPVRQGLDAPVRTDEGWAAGQSRGDWSRYRTGAPKGDMEPLGLRAEHRTSPETARAAAGVAAVLSGHPVTDRVLAATAGDAPRKVRADTIAAVLTADDLDDDTRHTILTGLAPGASREHVRDVLDGSKPGSVAQTVARMRGVDPDRWRAGAITGLLDGPPARR